MSFYSFSLEIVFKLGFVPHYISFAINQHFNKNLHSKTITLQYSSPNFSSVSDSILNQ
ncbi:hypothetical protein MtrunA17_Chr7g0236581 [Medicago truncatula]|uniref:Uncharacterized protein n=1 Tax=Medicago truncatula TaxID=3880 RepID=A0A396GXU1_MEDTR|nr:hypothetical protein MtrunA17_Chr7g0236581 [Medicago truncatula]